MNILHVLICDFLFDMSYYVFILFVAVKALPSLCLCHVSTLNKYSVSVSVSVVLDIAQVTRIVCSYIMAHLDEHKLLSDKQHAFRKWHSCETQITTVINKRRNQLDFVKSTF